MIKACLNGSRKPQEHRALPTTPDALAADALACRQAGAESVHIHPRDAAGRETLEASACAAALEAIRQRAAGLPVGLTTGLWIAWNNSQRLESIERWTVLPDFCSVNVGEAGSDDLFSLLLDMRIPIEAGLTSVADGHLLIELGHANRCLRILIEIEPGHDDPIAAAAAIHQVLDAAGVRSRRLQHGMGDQAWPLLEDALKRGCDVRIGLEDTLTVPDGSPAASNAELVAAARQLAQQVTR